MNESRTFFVTDNIKVASALTTVGFKLMGTECIRKVINRQTVDTIICELEISHLGIEADFLRRAFEGGAISEINLANTVDDIIRKKGLTDEEYILLAFDAARSALNNRSAILNCVRNQKPLHAVQIGEGRTLIYRHGTPADVLQKLVNNA